MPASVFDLSGEERGLRWLKLRFISWSFHTSMVEQPILLLRPQLTEWSASQTSPVTVSREKETWRGRGDTGFLLLKTHCPKMVSSSASCKGSSLRFGKGEHFFCSQGRNSGILSSNNSTVYGRHLTRDTAQESTKQFRKAGLQPWAFWHPPGVYASSSGFCRSFPVFYTWLSIFILCPRTLLSKHVSFLLLPLRSLVLSLPFSIC